MWKVLKRVIYRKGKCNVVHKITVNDTEITNKQEISNDMNEYFLQLVVIWLKVFLRELMIFKPPSGRTLRATLVTQKSRKE